MNRSNTASSSWSMAKPLPMQVDFVKESPRGLPADREQELAHVISNGSTPQEKIAAVHTLVTSNVRLALSMALSIARAFHIEGKRFEEDLFSECLLALTLSAWKYQPTGTRFGSY